MILPRPVDVMIPCCKDRLQFALAVLDSKQAPLGALLAEREKEGELATTSLFSRVIFVLTTREQKNNNLLI